MPANLRYRNIDYLLEAYKPGRPYKVEYHPNDSPENQNDIRPKRVEKESSGTADTIAIELSPNDYVIMYDSAEYWSSK